MFNVILSESRATLDGPLGDSNEGSSWDDAPSPDLQGMHCRFRFFSHGTTWSRICGGRYAKNSLITLHLVWTYDLILGEVRSRVVCR
ncbi:unnamed protein product [Penicillium camemberti]|uniref:Str. FM013 n=1 Tax=Penicillium camemberti (strain FM 013) TaxID=1429867 RepID=A0A0G4NUL6_PENC3|nr:unnamed protein product [Penicillium camemberti]